MQPAGDRYVKTTTLASRAPFLRLAALRSLLLLNLLTESCIPRCDSFRDPAGHIDFTFAILNQKWMFLRYRVQMLSKHGWTAEVHNVPATLRS